MQHAAHTDRGVQEEGKEGAKRRGRGQGSGSGSGRGDSVSGCGLISSGNINREADAAVDA